jgi:dTMP kinase
MTTGRFITFEGGEGAGKSTQVRLLAERLTSCGRTTVLTREPGGTPFAEKVREIVLAPDTAPKSPLAEALLFSAARADHVEQLIAPALQRGDWVISDRFADSTRAYQGAGGGLARETVLEIERIALAGLLPDLTVVLDVDPVVGLARADQRRGAQTQGAFIVTDTFESRRLAFHQRLRQGFLDLARAEPERIVVLDGFQNSLTIADAVWQHVEMRLNPTQPHPGHR